MKRDWKIIKDILINAENDIVFDDLFKDNLILKHYHLLQDADYVQGYMTDTKYIKLNLTWKGYDLLDYLRKNKEINSK